MPSAILIFSRRLAIRAPECRSGALEKNLKSAIEGETYEYTEMYPGFAKTARDEGFLNWRSGLKLWQRRKNLMPGDSTKDWMDSVVEFIRRILRVPMDILASIAKFRSGSNRQDR